MKEIKILMEPIVKTYSLQMPFNASGLLVALVNDDKITYLQNPYIKWPKFDKDGKYEVKVYESKTKKDIYTTFTITYDNKLKQDIYYESNDKKGYFKINNKNISLFSYKKDGKEKVIPIFISDRYNGDYEKFMEEWGDRFDEGLIKEVKEEAKKQNIEIEFKEVK